MGVRVRDSVRGGLVLFFCLQRPSDDRGGCPGIGVGLVVACGAVLEKNLIPARRQCFRGNSITETEWQIKITDFIQILKYPLKLNGIALTETGYP